MEPAPQAALRAFLGAGSGAIDSLAAMALVARIPSAAAGGSPKMDGETAELLARQYLDAGSSQEAVDWALSQLMKGIETPSLVILAGLSNPLESAEVDHYLQRSINELGWMVPDRSELLWLYARRLAGRIIAHANAPLADLEPDAQRLYGIYCALDYPWALVAWFDFAEFVPSESGIIGPAEWRRGVVEEAARLLSTGSS